MSSTEIEAARVIRDVAALRAEVARLRAKLAEVEALHAGCPPSLCTTRAVLNEDDDHGFAEWFDDDDEQR